MRAQPCLLAGDAVGDALRVGALRVDMVGVIPLIGPRNSNIEGLNYIIKRGFDIVAALACWWYPLRFC